MITIPLTQATIKGVETKLDVSLLVTAIRIQKDSVGNSVAECEYKVNLPGPGGVTVSAGVMAIPCPPELTTTCTNLILSIAKQQMGVK
jgi:hypothetical protein